MYGKPFYSVILLRQAGFLPKGCTHIKPMYHFFSRRRIGWGKCLDALKHTLIDI